MAMRFSNLRHVHSLKKLSITCSTWWPKETRNSFPLQCVILGFWAPINLTDRRFYLGLRNVFQHLVTNVAKLEASLSKRLRKNKQTTFCLFIEAGTKSIYAQKEVLMPLPVLLLPILTCHIILEIDVCTVQIGFDLIQQRKNKSTKQIDYW